MIEEAAAETGTWPDDQVKNRPAVHRKSLPLTDVKEKFFFYNQINKKM